MDYILLWMSYSFVTAHTAQNQSKLLLDHTFLDLINIFKGNLGCNREHHSQTIHPTENFNSMNLLQMFCVITGDQKKSASNLRKKIRPVFSFTYQKFRVRVNHTITHNLTKEIILICVWYQNASTSQILEPSTKGLISSDYYKVLP